MKILTLLIAFIFLLPVSVVFAQYQPLAVENAQWFVHDFFEDRNDMVETYNYFISGDTAVAGENYKKVYRRTLDYTGVVANFQPPYSYFPNTTTLVGLVRDEVPEERVYGIVYEQPTFICEDSEEQLLYDFSLLAGDTLDGCMHRDTFDFQGQTEYRYRIIDSVGTTTWRGISRATLYLPSQGFFDRLIEGVGGDTGPFTATEKLAFLPGVFIRLTDYCIGTDVECGLEPTSTQNSAPSIGLSIYPNPTNGETLYVNAQVDCSETLDAALFDALGRPVWQSASVSCTTFPVEIITTTFPAGAYHLSLRGSFGVATQRVVVR